VRRGHTLQKVALIFHSYTMLKRPLITPSKFRVPRSIFFCSFKGRLDYFIFVVNKLAPFIRVSYINDISSKLKACVQQFRRTLKTNTWQGDVAEIRYDNGGTNTPIRVWELDFTRELGRRTETTDVTFLCHLQDIHYMIVSKRCKRRTACIQLQEIIVDCRCNWTQNLLRMTDTRILKFAFEYTQTGKGTLDRPRKDRPAPMKTPRWSICHHFAVEEDTLIIWFQISCNTEC